MKRFIDIEPGDRVTILVHAGISSKGPEKKPATGKAVICHWYPGYVTLNMGGRHGTPQVATPENTLKVNGKAIVK